MKINIEQIKEDIQRVYDNKEQNEKVEMLFTVGNHEIVFGGHAWSWNSFYTIEDLQRMNCFKVMLNCNEEYYTLGTRVILNQKELETLANISIKGD